jgi:hypothetical protein
MSRKVTQLAAFAILLCAFSACPLAAQGVPRTLKVLKSPAPASAAQAPANRLVVGDEENARETRERLNNLLRQYPPSLGEVLRIDPTLLTNEGYLAPYPALVAFLAQHPEVAHNPGYFIGEFRFNSQETNATYRKINLIEGILAGLAVFCGFLTVIAVVGWLLKTLIDYRRWLRLSKVQTEVHTKLIDRFTSNEELLAYIQTPVGRRFLESAPIPMDAGPRAISAPVGRILWSVQAGLVVGLAGVGLLYVSARLAANNGDLADVAQVPFVVGMLALAIGVGFVLSALVSYFLSLRLGLFEQPVTTPHA